MVAGRATQAGGARPSSRSRRAGSDVSPSSPLVSQAGEPRSARVESLRAVAALGVVAGHVVVPVLARPGEAGFAERVVFGGSFGVYLFFALSGYLLFLPFARHMLGAGERPDLRRYALNRALRILPLYYVALTVYLVIRSDGGTLKQWLVFASFGENFFERTILTLNPVLWSLVIELHFYLLLPLLAWLLAKLAAGSPGRLLAAIGALAAAGFALRWTTLYSDPSPDPILRYSVVSSFMFFAPGMAIAAMRVAWEDRRPRVMDGSLGAPNLWLATAAGLWLGMALGANLGWLMAPVSFLIVGACVLPLRQGSWALRALEWRPLALVGVASYSIYIWHILILTEFFRPAGIIGLRALLPVIPTVIVVAALSYVLIERRFLRLRRGWQPRGTPARAPSVA